MIRNPVDPSAYKYKFTLIKVVKMTMVNTRRGVGRSAGAKHVNCTIRASVSRPRAVSESHARQPKRLGRG
jgi:hypothetical protein